MRIRVSGRELENLKYIMGYEISVPKAISRAERRWGQPALSAERVAELEEFMSKFWRRLGGDDE